MPFENGREELRSLEVLQKQQAEGAHGPDGDSRPLTPADFDSTEEPDDAPADVA